MILENRCDNCLHKGICRLEEELTEVIESNIDAFNRIREENNFEIEIKCKRFLENAPVSRSVDVKKIETDPEDNNYWPNLKYAYSSYRSACEGCPTYEKAKKGEIVVGDQCSWCSKNQWKVTCGDTPETISINNSATSADQK